MTDQPLLSVRDYTVDVPRLDGGLTRLVHGVSFDVYPGEVLGIVGESGSGKSLTMLGVMGLLPSPLRMSASRVEFRGRDLTTLSFEEMRSIRGNRMSMIFQDPMTSLNPVIRIGTQIAEVIALHKRDWSRERVRDRVIELLDLVGIPDARRRAGQFPNEFSGGMRQRAMIAMALANEPDLLIADEPTTALDVTIQAQIMEVLAEVRARTGAAMVLITHDLGLVAEKADRVSVMYGGRLMEQAATAPLLHSPRHPYTAGLLASLPDVDGTSGQLYSIPGHVPDMSKAPSGCVFHPRCAMSRDRAACREVEPAPRTLDDGRLTACHFAEEVDAWVAEAIARETVAAPREKRAAGKAVLEVEHLSKTYRIARAKGWGRDDLRAVEDVSFTLKAGTTLGLVGESGCGKTTLGRLILRLVDSTRGEIRLKGTSVGDLGASKLRPHRRDMQVVFQDPYASLNPRMSVHDIIAEPLRINGGYSRERIVELLGHVGLSEAVMKRRPPEFSGGQRQRIAIARALALNPEVLVLDEAVSALDVSIRAQVLNLLVSLQERLGLAYLFISHDLSVVRHISDDIAVMYLGKLVEFGPCEEVFERPAHPYTQALISAIPRPDPASAKTPGRVILKGEMPNPASPPSGCSFRTRCPLATELCAREAPALSARTGQDAHLSACHYAGSDIRNPGSLTGTILGAA